MLFILVAVLLILWMLGLVTSYTMMGLAHVLLFIAFVLVLPRVIGTRRPW